MMQEVIEQEETDYKEVGKSVKKNKIKYILSAIIFLLGFVFYIGFIIIWQDNNTTYALYDCTKSQKETIQKETNVAFADSTEIKEIVYYWTWGNDIPRAFSIKLQMNIEDYEKFAIEEMDHMSIKDIQQNDKICTVQMIYISDTYTPLASWMEDNGQENIGYKRSISLGVFAF